MSGLTLVILIFSVLGAIGYLVKDKLGLGEEFGRGFKLLEAMSLSMIGMIVISPLIADVLEPVFAVAYEVLHIDPSIIPASLFANDMGGAPLSLEVAKNDAIGKFNAYVVSAMMGCTVSFTIPASMKMVDEKCHRYLILGLLCGVVTIPIGCFVAGLVCDLEISLLLIDLMPIVILAGIIALGLWFVPEASIKIFKFVGNIINVIIILGLMLGIVNFLAKDTLIKGIATVEEGALVCFNATIVMTGMFPLIKLVSILLKKPLDFTGKKIGINRTSMTGLFSSLATSMTTFGMISDMDKKGIMLNSAFAVSGAFTFAGHLAFTMAFDSTYIVPVIIGKLVSGVFAVLLAIVLYNQKDF